MRTQTIKMVQEKTKPKYYFKAEEKRSHYSHENRAEYLSQITKRVQFVFRVD